MIESQQEQGPPSVWDRMLRVYHLAEIHGWSTGRLILCLVLLCLVPLSYVQLTHLSRDVSFAAATQLQPTTRTLSIDIDAALSNATRHFMANKSIQVAMWVYDESKRT